MSTIEFLQELPVIKIIPSEVCSPLTGTGTDLHPKVPFQFSQYTPKIVCVKYLFQKKKVVKKECF